MIAWLPTSSVARTVNVAEPAVAVSIAAPEATVPVQLTASSQAKSAMSGAFRSIWAPLAGRFTVIFGGVRSSAERPLGRVRAEQVEVGRRQRVEAVGDPRQLHGERRRARARRAAVDGPGDLVADGSGGRGQLVGRNGLVTVQTSASAPVISGVAEACEAPSEPSRSPAAAAVVTP